MKDNPLQNILMRTATDKAYREKFMKDPAGELQRAGIHVPEGKKIKVLENTDDHMFIVLPTSAQEQPANWERAERPAPGERKESGSLVMEWNASGLSLKGRIDSSSASGLRAELDRVTGNLCMDFTGVTYMASAGIAVLLSAQKRLQPGGKEISLYNVSAPIRNVFALSSMDTLFRFLSPVDFRYSSYIPVTI